MTSQHVPEEWAFEFHGHRCPFMPIGYRMGRLAMEYLGVERGKDHGFFVFPEIGEGHPQTCLVDGLQIATGATYGKVLIAKTFYGKLACTFYHPKKGTVRYSLKPDFHGRDGQVRVFRLPQARYRAIPDPTASHGRGHQLGVRAIERLHAQGGAEAGFQVHPGQRLFQQSEV